MRLLPNEIRRRLPPLYTTEHEKDAIAQVRFFSMWSNWVWYATEFDGEDLFFGLVEGFETEWGYFSLQELESAKGPCNVPLIERDISFHPTPMSKLSIRNLR